MLEWRLSEVLVESVSDSLVESVFGSSAWAHARYARPLMEKLADRLAFLQPVLTRQQVEVTLQCRMGRIETRS